MAISFTLSSFGPGGSETGSSSVYLRGTLAFSGNYATGGDTLDLTQTVLPPGLILGISQPPKQGWIAGSSGYNFAFLPGSALNNGKVKITSAAGTEVSAGGYPAGITGDANVVCELECQKMQ